MITQEHKRREGRRPIVLIGWGLLAAGLLLLWERQRGDNARTRGEFAPVPVQLYAVEQTADDGLVLADLAKGPPQSGPYFFELSAPTTVWIAMVVVKADGSLKVTKFRARLAAGKRAKVANRDDFFAYEWDPHDGIVSLCALAYRSAAALGAATEDPPALSTIPASACVRFDKEAAHRP